MAEYLKKFVEGEEILAKETNDNNDYLLNQIDDRAGKLNGRINSISASVSSQLETFRAELDGKIGGKVDIDFNNMDPNQEAKEIIASWAFPDYSAGVNITSGYTVEKQGWVNCISGSGGTALFYVNGIVIANSYSGSGGDMYSAFVPVNKDDVVSATGNISVFKFYPMKGSEDVVL